MSVHCFYPSQDDREELPDGYDEWAPESGLCEHDWCIEGNNVRRLFEATPKISREEWDEIRSDHELMRDEFHTIVVEDTGGYVVVADMEAR